MNTERERKRESRWMEGRKERYEELRYDSKEGVKLS